jgi:imidazoleglycerol-phosphate dehydratase
MPIQCCNAGRTGANGAAWMAGTSPAMTIPETAANHGLTIVGTSEEKSMRRATVTRKTKETDLEVTVDLDGTGSARIATGIGFFDHMLDQLARHSLIDLDITAKGDLHIDFHHTVEDTGLALGQAVRRALGDLAGITRYADVHLPMDETLTRVAIDVSGRPFLVFKTAFQRAKIGEFDSELVREFFQAFAMSAAMTIHVETLYGVNDHHIAESCFKGLARALAQAISIDPRRGDRVPSTKGTLTDRVPEP